MRVPSNPNILQNHESNEFLSLISLAIALTTYAGAARAQSIGMELSMADSATEAGSPIPGGVVPQIHWNHMGTVSGTLSAIVDNIGAVVSGVSAVWGTVGANTIVPLDSNFSNPGDNNLYSLSIDTFGSGPGNPYGTYITVSGIPYGSYDVYAYFRGNANVALVNLNGKLGNASGIADGKSLKLVIMGNDARTKYVAATEAGGPADYAVFRGVKGATATVNFQGDGAITGIQIVASHR